VLGDRRRDPPDELDLLVTQQTSALWEVRKVELFRDGRIAYADAKDGTTSLGDQPVPSIEEIVSNPELAATSIVRDEFEEIWNKAMDSAAS
jgi:hypothetical protein